MKETGDDTDTEERGFQNAALSGDASERLTAFAKLLQAANRETNLTRITSTEDIYNRHFRDTLQALPVLDQGPAGRLLDVGSGAGVPGLVLAVARPDWRVVSLEATGKKVAFQQQVVTALGINSVLALQGRAEQLAHETEHRACYDVVTARALASLPILLELCVPFAKVGGVILAYRGPRVREELAQHEAAMDALACRVEQVIDYSPDPGKGVDSARFHLVVFRKTAATPEDYPRSYARIRQTPLGTEPEEAV